MSRRLILGTFAEEHDLLEAVQSARAIGYPIVDVYTPYPVHGLDEAMGLKRSRLSIFCFVCGSIGVLAAMALQHWTMAIDWPINIGGRPFNSWPAFVPVAFEVLVLFAGFGVVFAFLGVSRLFPGKTAWVAGPRVTNDQFLLAIEGKDLASDVGAVRAMFLAHHAIDTLEQEQGSAGQAPTKSNSRRVNSLLLAIFVLASLMNWFLGADHRQPNREFLPDMVHAVPHESFAAHEGMPKKMVLQAPPAGAIARGHLPLHYQATPKDAEKAGEELQSPFKPGDTRAVNRGVQVFANYCTPCHGSAGAGDGAVSQRGVPPPPSLLAEKAVKMKDGQMFHIITHGQANMASHAAQVEPNDRWAVILHIRQLQKAKGAGK